MTRIASIMTSLLLLAGCNTQESTTDFSPNTLRVALEGDPQTLDPRMARTLTDATVMQMLYEGLMRVNREGELRHALAQDIKVSLDLKTYEIHLKPSFWSDGSPLVAADFVETWRSMLDPAFPSPNAAQLFVIKGAKEAKEGSLPLQDVGLTTISDSSFSVELEQPTAYFLQLLSTHFYLPLPASVRSKGQPTADPHAHLYNGPFTLNEWKHHNQLTFEKNPYYWDSSHVKLKKILFVVADEMTALSLFEKNKLDWAGSPLSTLPQDAIPTLKKQKRLKMVSADATYWFRFNTQAAPFTSANMRKALNLALNRAEIVDHITQGNQRPALGLLPPSLSLQKKGFYEDNQVVAAWEHFQKALSELGISKDEVPPITLCYIGNDRNQKIAQAVQQQWQKAFNIPIALQSCEAKVSYDHLARGDYQVMLGSWFADFKDPVNFLNIFKSKTNGVNNTQWENASYAQLIDASNSEMDLDKRRSILLQAETLLMDEMPIAPLFYNTYNFVLKPHVSAVGLDFKNASIRDEYSDFAGE